MKFDTFEVTYYVEDGYAGKANPQHVTIEYCDIELAENEDELKEAIDDIVSEDFSMRISYQIENMEAAIAWFTSDE